MSFEVIANTAGFIYETEQDIYVTKRDCLQRLFGYSRIYDWFSLTSCMIIDCEPITFEYGSHTYLIELWKGQYNVMTGCEVGVYRRSIGRRQLVWECVTDSEMLDIAYQLIRNGQHLFSRHSVGWWVTGFKPGVFSKPSELVIKDLSITFPNASMCQSFTTALTKLGYTWKLSDEISGTCVRFDFVTPKTPQPWSPIIRQIGLYITDGMVACYNSVRQSSNNSPQTIDRILKECPIKVF